jgi:hypothetical protein
MKCAVLRTNSCKSLAIRLAVPCLLALFAVTTPALAAGNQFLKIEGVEGESMAASSPRIIGGDRVPLTEAGFRAFLQKNNAGGSEVQFYSIELLNASVAGFPASKGGKFRICVRDLCIFGKRVE